MGLSISGGCMEYRRLSPKETKLLETLIKRAGLSNILVDWRGVFVKPMAESKVLFTCIKTSTMETLL
jgi:hypothetical protein